MSSYEAADESNCAVVSFYLSGEDANDPDRGFDFVGVTGSSSEAYITKMSFGPHYDLSSWGTLYLGAYFIAGYTDNHSDLDGLKNMVLPVGPRTMNEEDTLMGFGFYCRPVLDFHKAVVNSFVGVVPTEKVVQSVGQDYSFFLNRIFDLKQKLLTVGIFYSLDNLIAKSHENYETGFRIENVVSIDAIMSDLGLKLAAYTRTKRIADMDSPENYYYDADVAVHFLSKYGENAGYKVGTRIVYNDVYGLSYSFSFTFLRLLTLRYVVNDFYTNPILGGSKTNTFFVQLFGIGD